MNSSTSPAPASPGLHTQGDFSSNPAPDLLVDLIRRRFTGTLRLERSGIVKVLYLSLGDFACASSNAEEDRLGNLLVRSGRLSAEQLAHAKARQSEKTSIGNTLVELGFITAAELLWGARRQVEEIVADLVGWRDGAYQLREAALSKEVVNLSLAGRTLVVRALQQISDRELVVERLGSMEAVLSRVEPFEEVARTFDFGFPVDALLVAVDGRSSVSAVCEAAGGDDFQTCKVLHTLLAFGLLQRTAPAAARELIFVEGELQNGEDIPRAGERAPRRARRQPSQDSSATKPPALAVVPPAPEPAAEPLEMAEASTSNGPTGEPTAPPEEPAPPRTLAPTRGGLRKLLWGGALLLGLMAILAGILYLTYFRPTLSPDDAEEARLLAALMEEAREDAAPPPAARLSERAAPPAAGAPGETAPPAAGSGRSASPAPPPPGPGAPPAPGPAAPPAGRASGVSPRSEPAAPAAPAGPRREPALLEKSPLPTMLSADGNFRRALDLVHDRRFPEAAGSFQRALRAQAPGAYTIQLLLACQDSTLEKAFNRAPDRTLYFVSTTFRGQACYRLFDGLYGSEAEARSNLDRTPSAFRQEGNQPVVVRAPQR